MRLKILILTNLLFLALTGCTSERVVDPKVAQDMIATAWYSDQHIVWQLGQDNDFNAVKPLLMQAQTAAQQLQTIEAYFEKRYLASYYDQAS